MSTPTFILGGEQNVFYAARVQKATASVFKGLEPEIWNQKRSRKRMNSTTPLDIRYLPT